MTWHRAPLLALLLVGIGSVPGDAVNLHVGSWLAPAHAAMNWGRDRVLLSGGANGGNKFAGSEVQLTGINIGTGLKPNLLLSNNTFASGWITQFGSGSDFQTAAPDSGTSASAFTETTGNGVHRLGQTITKVASSLPYIAVGRVKQGLRTRVLWAVEDTITPGTNGCFGVVDLAGVQIGVAATLYGSGFSSCSVSAPVSLTNGFVEFSLSVTTSTATTLALVIEGDNGSGTGAVSVSYIGSAASPAFFMYDFNLQQTTSASNVLSDSTLTNWWDSTVAQGWAGLDLGAGKSATFTRYRFAPRPGDTNSQSTIAYDYEARAQGALVQLCGVDPTCATSPSTVDTIPVTPYYARFNLNERTISGTARAIRMLMPAATFGSLSELQFFAKYDASIAALAQPVAPTISPWGGAAPSGSQAVTITSATKQASIYYTTDGSTPTAASTLYAGPFTLSVGASTVVKAIANWTTLGTPASAIAAATFFNYDFAPLADWYDDRGVLIEAHGGQVIWDSNTSLYYWIGAIANKYDPPWSQAPGSGNIIRTDVGVLMYSSPTAEPGSWTFVGNILAQPPAWTATERPHMLFNSANGHWVLWAHCLNINNIGAADRACVATNNAADPRAGWSWVNTNLDPDGVGFKDFSLFMDVDGVTAYVVYTNGAQTGLGISRLASDYLSTTATLALAGAAREAPQILVNPANGAYFLITSQSNFYQSNTEMGVKYVVNTGASPIANSWGALPGVSAFAVDPLGGSFNAQPSFNFVPHGKTQAVFGGDYWNTSFSGGSGFYASRQVWLPITFPTATTLQISVPATWNLSTLNFLLKRDIDPAANDNSPLFLNQAA